MYTQMNDIASIIITQARTWLGTPFHHQARLKGVGCDCLGLVVGVVDELGLKDKHGQLLCWYDEIAYSKEPDGAYLTQKLTDLLEEVQVTQAGDLALFAVRDNPQHLAIITDYPCAGVGRAVSAKEIGGLGMIHAYAPARRVVEHRLDDDWNSRLVKLFRWQLD